ncbi:MAG: hypothetical protein LBG10_10005 [Treponema sp.]|nr:hypothetical protein [Treponema sp.]
MLVLPALFTLLFCSVCSCSTGEAAGRILGVSAGTPVFLGAHAVSAGEITFQFSLPVRVITLNLSPHVEVASVEGGTMVTVHLAEERAGGERLTVDLLVEDDGGNTLNVLVPLRTRNDRIPPLLLTELRTEYSKPKTEFVEFKTLGAGNLGALRLFIAGYYKQPLVYEFSPVEVGAGEYILIHLRTPEEGTADETGSDLNLSGGTDAAAGARDFWISGSEKLLHKTDAVYFLDQDDRVVDGIMLSENADPWWNKEYLAAAADFLFKKGAWASPEGNIPGPADAVITAPIKTALTRSISRDESMEDSNRAADWFITATSGITPGKPNKARPAP